MFGGPIGKMIGSQIGSQIGQMFGQMISQFGQDNVAGGLSNSINHHAANIANQHVGHCGMPRFIQDEMSQFIGSWLQGNMQNVPSDCQNASDHVYDHVMNSNDNCTRTEGGGDGFTNAVYSCAKSEGKDKESKSEGNWLVTLAGALTKVQQQSLTAAMKNMETMKENGSAATQGKDDKQTAEEKETKRKEFLEAQSQYQANMQMFNMVANMTATSLKSLERVLPLLLVNNNSNRSVILLLYYQRSFWSLVF